MLPGLPDVAELQLLFAQYNMMYFAGEIPSHRIAYNARFSNLAGRVSYKPPLIELSPKHLLGKPEELRETLLHEMIHAWLHARGQNPGHTAAFKKKMRELGLRSIYHDLGTAAPLNESPKRYIVRCEKCFMEVLRKRKPAANLVCARCRKPLVAFEVVEMRPVELGRAALRGQR
jgi:predicted SprT family Zn-dependent metalloprotease